MTSNHALSAGVEWANKNPERTASMTATNQTNTGAINYNEGSPERGQQKGRPMLVTPSGRSQPGGESR